MIPWFYEWVAAEIIVIYCKILSAKIIKGVLDNDAQEWNKMNS